MDIVAKIDALRKERGWSVNKLATEAMLTQSTVANMFSSGAEPKISTLKAICDAFDITLAQFFCEIEDENDGNFDIAKEYRKLSKRDKAIVETIVIAMQN